MTLSSGLDDLPSFVDFVHSKVKCAIQSTKTKHFEDEGVITLKYPPVQRSEKYQYVTLLFECSLLGPGRVKSWTGKSIKDCISEARKDIEAWSEQVSKEDPWESSSRRKSSV